MSSSFLFKYVLLKDSEWGVKHKLAGIRFTRLPDDSSRQS
jgi:hypothetical protein